MSPILIGAVLILIAIFLLAGLNLPSQWHTQNITAFFYFGIVLVAGSLIYLATGRRGR